MRVSSNNFVQSSLRQLQVLQQQQNAQQTKLATGQKVNNLQEDTLLGSKVLKNQELQKELSQYKTNALEADAVAQVSYDNLNYLGDLVSAAQDLTENEAFEGRPELFLNQIDGYIDDALSVANAMHDGEYLFGGTATGQEPFIKVKSYELPAGVQAFSDTDGDGVAEDLDGDGIPDLAFDNLGNPVMTTGVTTVNIPIGLQGLATDANGDVEDLDGDGILDFATDALGSPVYIAEEDTDSIKYVGASDGGRGVNVSEGVNIQPFASLETSESIETFLNGLISYRDGKLSEFNTQDNLDAAEQAVVDADEALISATTVYSEASRSYNDALDTNDPTQIADALVVLNAADAARTTAEGNLTTAQTTLSNTQVQAAVDFETAYATQENANEAIRLSEDGIIDGMGELSMKQYRMETLSTRDAEKYATIGLDNTESLAADTTETVIELLNTQQAYQGAMQSISKIMDLSLLNYI